MLQDLYPRDYRRYEGSRFAVELEEFAGWLRKLGYSRHCTRGRDFPLSLLAERLRCPRCGSRRVAVIYDPPAGIGRIRATSPV